MAYQTSKITAVPYFYDKQLRRYIQQFIRIFAGFQVAMHSDAEGNVVYQTAPVRYGDVSRMAAHIVRENSENMTQTTPFISCHVTGLETAPDRRTSPQYEETVPVFEKKYDEATGSYINEQGNAYSITRHQPVPYNLTMQVDVWTSNTEQKLQLLEQILVLFNPTLNIHTSNNPLDWSTLSYVELIASTWSVRAIPSGIDDIIDISTMTFTMPVLINPPAKVTKQSSSTPYAFRYEFTYKSENLEELAKAIETVEKTEILSIGKGLELIKDLGDATTVSDQYGLGKFMGTHGIGHTRMATESDVDIKSAHPYWAFPYQDVAVVHNGQLTNYWGNRRVLERSGYRFNSNCDSEIIAVYIADKMSKGIELEQAMNDSLDELDGVFTYIVSTKDQLGMAKDHMAAKPMVIYEGKDVVALSLIHI